MLHEHALRSFETQEAILEAVDQRVRALEPDAIAASREVHTFMAGLVERAVPSGGMVIVGPNNRILSGSANFPASQTVDLSDRDYVRAHREGHRGTYVGEVIVARPQNTTVFSISRRRTRADGSLGQGLIVASFKPDYFSDFYRSVTETPDDVVVLLREDGGLLARSPQPPNVEAYSQRFRTPVSAAAQRDGRAFAAVTSPVDGRARQYGFRRVGTYPVFVAYGLSTDVARHAWYRQLAVSGTICTVAALLLMIFTLLAQGSVRRERAALAAARAEAERRADAERRLRHAQRIDALGQLVGGVAHDFNNVVMAVVAGARSIAKRADRPDEVRRIVGLIEAAADRGARLTGRMLAFARREDARSDAVDVADALRSVADLLGHTLGSGLTVALDLPDSPASRPRRPHGIRNRGGQPRDQRPRCDARRRHGDDPGPRGNDRGAGPDPCTRPPARTLPARGRDRPGHRHGSRDPRPRRRSLLHHEGTGQGNGPGPRHGTGLRRAGRRRAAHRQRARPGHHGDLVASG
jgi:two-component system NtrC family sensor kinase